MDFISDRNNFSVGETSTTDSECKSFGPIPCTKRDFLSNSKGYTTNYGINFNISAPCFPSSEANIFDFNIDSIFTRPKNCTICNEDLTRSLDGRCSKCGYKPSLIPRYPKYDLNFYNQKNITVEDILRDWKNEMNNDYRQGKYLSSPDRCKCTKDSVRPCAYCRIKENCRELFENAGKIVSEQTNLFRKIKGDNNYNNRHINTKKNDKTIKGNETATTICKDILSKNGTKSAFRSSLEKLKKVYGAKEYKKSTNGIKSKIKDPRKPLKNKETFLTIYRKIFKSPRVQNNNKNEIIEEKKLKKKIKRLNKKLYGKKHRFRTYLIPANFPRININRHINCLSSVRVPRNMGWLWTVFTQENSNWKPGYIPKPIKELMLHFIKPVDVLPLSPKTRCQQTPSNFISENFLEKSTLNIKRINGNYIITMHPLKDAKSLRENADPYLDMKPIRFVISKQISAVKEHEIKKTLKDKGFKKCSCHKPVTECICRSHGEKQQLEKEILDICRNEKIPDIRNKICLTDTTDTESDLDFDFTPPAGLIKCALIRKPDAAVKETQYDPADYQKAEPYESPFKIKHPNYKAPTKSSLIMKKLTNHKEIRKDKEVGKKKSEINDGKQKKELMKTNKIGKGGRGDGDGEKDGNHSASLKKMKATEKTAKKINPKSKSEVELEKTFKKRKKPITSALNASKNKNLINKKTKRGKRKNVLPKADKFLKKVSIIKNDEPHKIIQKQQITGIETRKNIENKKKIDKSRKILKAKHPNEIQEEKKIKVQKRRRSLSEVDENRASKNNRKKLKTKEDYSFEKISINNDAKIINSKSKKNFIKNREKGWDSRIIIHSKPKLKSIKCVKKEPMNNCEYNIDNCIPLSRYGNLQQMICNNGNNGNNGIPKYMPSYNSMFSCYPYQCCSTQMNNYCNCLPPTCCNFYTR